MGAPRITEDEFNKVKLLQHMNALTKRQIAEIVGRSYEALKRVFETDSYEEYLKMRYENSKERNVKRPLDKQPAPQGTIQPPVNPTVVRVEATHYMMQELQKTNELLTAISRKLAFVVDELCGTKKEG